MLPDRHFLSSIHLSILLSCPPSYHLLSMVTTTQRDQALWVAAFILFLSLSDIILTTSPHPLGL